MKKIKVIIEVEGMIETIDNLGAYNWAKKSTAQRIGLEIQKRVIDLLSYSV